MAIVPFSTNIGASVGSVGISMPYADPFDVWIVLVETANQWVSGPTVQVQVSEEPLIIDNYPMTLIGNTGTGTAGGTASTAIRAYGHRCFGNEESIFVPDQGDHQAAIAVAFKGVKQTGAPWVLGATGVEASPTTAMAIPGYTSSRPGSLYIGGCAIATDTNVDQFPPGANADLAGFGKQTSFCTNVGNGGGISMYIGEKASIGLIGATTGILSGASVQALLSLELLPEPSGGRKTGMRWL